MLKGWIAAPALALLLGGASLAQGPAGGPGKRVGSPTRQVVMFGELEKQLLDARQDKTLLDAMLTEDFQEWNAERPDAAMDRQTALTLAPATAGMQTAFRDMNVRIEGETAIVSFVLLHREMASGRPRAGATFVVDVWRKHGEAYELAARYSAPMHMPKDLQPTGKE